MSIYILLLALYLMCMFYDCPEDSAENKCDETDDTTSTLSLLDDDSNHQP